MKDIQNSILVYAENNKYLSIVTPFSEIFLLIYPVYLLLIKITALNAIWNVVEWFSAIFYVCYVAGLILSFARNKIVALDIAFVLLAVNRLFVLGNGINLSRLVYFLYYLALAVIAVRATRNTDQWEETINITNRQACYQHTDGGINSISKGIENAAKPDFVFCCECGRKLPYGSRFCDFCGYEIKK